MSIARVSPGQMWRYYLRGVVVGDGQRPAGRPLPLAQGEAGVPAGVWMGRGLPALGLSGTVGERQMELLYGQGRHPEADWIEAERLAAGESPVAARRATVLGRPVEQTASAVLAFDLVFRPQPTVTLLWALGDEQTRKVIEDCHEQAIDRTLTWIEDTVAQVRWGNGGIHRAPASRLVVARFRHFDNRNRMPLLHDHCLVSVKVRRPDGAWGNLDSRRLYQHVVAAGALYNLMIMEQVCERLGLASEPRTVTEGARPVMDIAGVPHELVDWAGTRSRDIAAVYDRLVRTYRAEHKREPGERARARLSAWAAEETRPAKKSSLPLVVLRARWRASAIREFGIGLVDGLLERARAAAVLIRARVRRVVDVALAAVDVVAVVYVMRGVFRRRHLLAEARRHLAQTLRGRRHEPGLDERIVDAALREHCVEVTGPPPPGHRPPSPELRTYTANFRPADLGATLSGKTHSPSRYQRAQIASTVLTNQLRAERRACRTASSRQARIGSAPNRQPGLPGDSEATAATRTVEPGLTRTTKRSVAMPGTRAPQQEPGSEMHTDLETLGYSAERLQRLSAGRRSRERARRFPDPRSTAPRPAGHDDQHAHRPNQDSGHQPGPR